LRLGVRKDDLYTNSAEVILGGRESESGCLNDLGPLPTNSGVRNASFKAIASIHRALRFSWDEKSRNDRLVPGAKSKREHAYERALKKGSEEKLPRHGLDARGMGGDAWGWESPLQETRLHAKI